MKHASINSSLIATAPATVLSDTTTIVNFFAKPTVLPPSKFKGKLSKKWYKKERHLKLKTTWKRVSGVQSYEIFANKKHIATIKGNKKPVFKKHLDPKHYYIWHLKKYKKFLSERYTIRSVNACGSKSAFIPLDI